MIIEYMDGGSLECYEISVSGNTLYADGIYEVEFDEVAEITGDIEIRYTDGGILECYALKFLGRTIYADDVYVVDVDEVDGIYEVGYDELDESVDNGEYTGTVFWTSEGTSSIDKAEEICRKLKLVRDNKMLLSSDASELLEKIDETLSFVLSDIKDLFRCMQ